MVRDALDFRSGFLVFPRFFARSILGGVRSPFFLFLFSLEFRGEQFEILVCERGRIHFAQAQADAVLFRVPALMGIADQDVKAVA